MSQITLLYVKGEEIGYARMGSYIAAELFQRGITVWDDDGRPASAGENPKSQARKVAEGRMAAPTPANVICWASVPTHASGYFDGQYKAILTMWEATRIPEDFRATLHEFDLVMVPSKQNMEIFSQFHDNVKYVPLGIDPSMWNYSPPPPVHATFDFLISGRGERKGADIAYEAFQTVFGQYWQYNDNHEAQYQGPEGKPVPRLIMKSLKGHGQYYSPGVKHVTGRLDAQAEVDLYRSAHCYLQPSRGEGFGLQPLQALAIGRPTILTAAHGHESYAHLGIGISSTMVKSGEFVYGDAGEWWEPDFEEVCEAMWDVYEHYDDHAASARIAAEEVAENWTWSDTTDKFLAAFDGALEQPYTGDGTWKNSVQRLFRIVTLEDHTSHAAGIMRHFEKGKEYWDLADIKRILFDAGKLDPVCLVDDDHGLAPQQLVGLDEYIAAKSSCPTCQQSLNTLPMRGNLIYENMLLKEQVEQLEMALSVLRGESAVDTASIGAVDTASIGAGTITHNTLRRSQM